MITPFKFLGKMLFCNDGISTVQIIEVACSPEHVDAMIAMKLAGEIKCRCEIVKGPDEKIVELPWKRVFDSIGKTLHVTPRLPKLAMTSDMISLSSFA